MSHSGDQAEALAAAYLERQGLQVVERNYRCRQGEIDLIMRDNDTLVFVEVRLRTNPRFGSAAESITQQKQGKILQAARHYLAGQRKLPQCRFDAVLLGGLGGGAIEWLKNAFTE